MVHRGSEVDVVFDDVRIINESYALYGVNVKITRAGENSVRQTFEQHVFRRYSEFWDLKNKLEKEFRTELPYDLPNRGFGLWSKNKLSSEVIESRKNKLAKFLRDMLNDSFDTKWKNSPLVASFLKLPAGWNETNAHVTPNQIDDRTDLDLGDPSQWMISFRDSKTLLSQCKKDGSSDNTRNLMKLRLSLYQLENALDATRRSRLLNETELNRRHSLLQALKSDINEMALHSGLGKITSNDAVDIGNEKTVLFTGVAKPKSPKKPLAGRRRIGETEETLQLNKQQLLQLHKDKIAEQDQELGQMHMIIQRQKALSLEMNQELSQQNDLLDLLGNDIDNTSSKLRTANRRAKQFNSD
ncbi:hypothetical protein HG535_0B02550 [Zygotorulaspora mrakii]|uniref:PX domain-containing protein n=1 Tax=Zygotorulaspora mrakii TaxID=42260 RepID=A0A7H9AY92_ZYGMR|nr:uncharacterized protein HG535_0B02550 [Zygotorulaspora mrakii]QLG71216.1 hypothetical protein HG535_0B02550 [Zygotorulaspora mrakii]